jgi:hypothetical protein
MKQTKNKTERVKTLKTGSAVKLMKEAIASDGEIVLHLNETDVYFSPNQEQSKRFWTESQEYAQAD